MALTWWQRPRVVIVSAPPLDEEALIKAYSVPVLDRQYQATMQILEKHIQEAHQNAELASSKEHLPHFYNGGAECVGRVREDIVKYRGMAAERSAR